MNAGDARTPDRLERALQASLRPVDPGPAFTAALQARLAGGEVRVRPLALTRSVGRSQHRWHSASLAAAASVVVALAVGWQMADVRAEQQAAQARLEQARIHSQVLLALEITSERLGLAQQRIEHYRSQENAL